MPRQTSPCAAFLLLLIGLGPFLPSGLLTAQAPAACIGEYSGTFQITLGVLTANLPPNTGKLVLVYENGTVADDKLTAVQRGSWTPSQADIDKLTQAQPSKARLQFLQADGKPGCTRAFNVTTPSNVKPPGPASGPSNVGAGSVTETVFAQTDCSKAGAAWAAELARRPGHRVGGFTELVFLESPVGGDANVCYYNRDYGVVGDPIYVGVFGQKAVTWLATRFEPCSAQPVAPKIQQSSEKFPSDLHAGTWQLQTFLERRCYNTAVDVSIVGNHLGENVVQRYPLTQYDRYRGTVQAGILYTDLHNAAFGLRQDQSDTNKTFIYDKGPSNRGPEYIATLNLYAILKYLPSLLGRSGGTDYGTYAGRDPIHDQDILDRIVAILGVGITNPTRRFSVGASFEVIYGISAIWVQDFAKVTELAPGTSTTVPFTGTEAEIPTIFVWRHRAAWGLSIDLRYMSALLTGNRQ
jgi:hypothetical protein